MLYSVDLALGNDQTDEDWNEWQAAMKPSSALLTVPGFRTAQRFKGVGLSPPPYLALYTINSADVLTSNAYRNIGGGGLTAARWKPLITLWHRNVFDGPGAVPLVAETATLLVKDAVAPDEADARPVFTWWRAAGLDRSTAYRGLAVFGSDAVSTARAAMSGVRAYRPIGPPMTGWAAGWN